jgi:drug/metabolite transporter (DMT)-like permease
VRRWTIFGLIGPFVGFLVFVGSGGGFRSHAVQSFLVVLPFAMVAGFVPAMVTATFDRLFERRGVRQVDRLFRIALVGYGAAYLLMLENLFETTPLISFQYRWGLIGAVPAVICSWLNKPSMYFSQSG